ncbi:MAG: hypothetical protein ACTHNM_06345 [Dyella sp.]|uniref:hypothetical protein n=1 Tax=Dyella sp. TaxID=1869338 RepID=UPI003F8160D7
MFVLAVLFAIVMPRPCAAASAATPENIYFAGVAYSADAADVAKEFPHLSKVLDSQVNASLSALVRERLQGQASAPKLIFDQLGSIKDASHSTALALAIDGEVTSIIKIGDLYKTRLEISAQLLFFDFKEKQVLGAFPIILDYIDTGAQPPDGAKLDALYRAMLLGSGGRGSLADEFVKTLAGATVPAPSSRHLRVTSVDFEPKAIAYLQQSAPNADVATVSRQVAREFGKYLSTNQNLAILPFASSQALGGSMAARFVEGDAYQLKIPEADYGITIKVSGFKKLEQGRTATSIGYIYGAFVDLAVTEPLSGRTYFAQQIRQGANQTVPVTQSSTEDWANAYDTLRLLFNNFTMAISDPRSGWVKTSMPDSSNAKNQMTSLQGLVQSCR